MKREDFRFFHRLRVRWAEVDMQKIVFNAHYLMYFDTAIADYWRALALPYEQSMQALQGDLYVKKATVEFHASARMDDSLDVAMQCQRIGTSSIVFQCAIFRAEDLLISGQLLYVFADPVAQTSKPVPQALRQVLLAYEQGQSVMTVRMGDWASLGAAAGALRNKVFVQEQHVPQESEWDDADADALHAVAYNLLGEAIGTGRLLRYAPGVAKIGRMAVERTLRGAGVGAALLRALIQAAQARGEQQVLLHAQKSAQGFYERLGFVTQGQSFEEANIMHIQMVKAL